MFFSIKIFFSQAENLPGQIIFAEAKIKILMDFI